MTTPATERTRIGADGRASEAVIETVAAAAGVDPATLDPPLYDVVDPDALDRLFHDREQPSPDGAVTFTMAGCRVVVRGTGTVTATPAADPDGDPFVRRGSPTSIHADGTGPESVRR